MRGRRPSVPFQPPAEGLDHPAMSLSSVNRRDFIHLAGGAALAATLGRQLALAGPVAEMLYSGEPYHPGLVPEWANDWQSAWELAESLFAAPRQRLDHLEKVVSRLYRLLDTEPNWSAVAAIADSLLAHETLEFEEVKQIVSDWLD